jgi:Tol biopolymer transport system component
MFFLLPEEIQRKISYMALMKELIETTEEFESPTWSNDYQRLTVSEYYHQNYFELFDEFIDFDDNYILQSM